MMCQRRGSNEDTTCYTDHSLTCILVVVGSGDLCGEMCERGGDQMKTLDTDYGWPDGPCVCIHTADVLY